MKYLVILDQNSTIGTIYAKGNNDGIINDGHPALVCTEIKTDNPHYIFVTRELNPPASHQSLYLPYHSVVLIVQFEESDAPPFGFACK